jgi:hypothetical protein
MVRGISLKSPNKEIMKDIIILGMGGTRVDCPFDSEVWGVNTGYRQAIQMKGKLDKVFIAHRGQEYDFADDPIFNFDEFNLLVGVGIEIVSLFDVKEITKITRYPFEEIVKKFDTMYFSDTIAYMIAYALHYNTKYRKDGTLKLKEPMRIRMYGVDMHTKDEYATERGGIEYFIGVAKTLGVDFWIHPDSSVCKTTTLQPYGFFTLDKKIIDPYDLMKIQTTTQGIDKMVELGVVNGSEAEALRCKLSLLQEAQAASVKPS